MALSVGTEFPEKSFVGAMLQARFLQVDGLARDERELAMDDCGTYGAGDGSEHGGRSSLHENVATR